MMRFAFYPIVRTFTSIAVGILLLGAGARAQAEDAAGGEVVGFEDVKGKTSFLHDFKGKPVIINLWATWCAPCVEEMPSLSKLQEEYAAKGLIVLALSEDDSMDTAIAYYKKTNISSLTPYLDRGHAIYTALNTIGLPTTVFVDRNGNTVQRIEGPVDWQAPMVKVLVDELMVVK